MENVEDADFVLAHGTEALGTPSGDACAMSLQDLEGILELCASKGIPMVVANPDYVTVEARDLRVMPGEFIVLFMTLHKLLFKIFYPKLQQNILFIDNRAFIYQTTSLSIVVLVLFGWFPFFIQFHHILIRACVL